MTKREFVLSKLALARVYFPVFIDSTGTVFSTGAVHPELDIMFILVLTNQNPNPSGLRDSPRGRYSVSLVSRAAAPGVSNQLEMSSDIYSLYRCTSPAQESHCGSGVSEPV